MFDHFGNGAEIAQSRCDTGCKGIRMGVRYYAQNTPVLFQCAACAPTLTAQYFMGALLGCILDGRGHVPTVWDDDDDE